MKVRSNADHHDEMPMGCTKNPKTPKFFQCEKLLPNKPCVVSK